MVSLMQLLGLQEGSRGAAGGPHLDHLPARKLLLRRHRAVSVPCASALFLLELLLLAASVVGLLLI